MTIKEAHTYMEDLQRAMTQYRNLFSEEFICANGMAIEALEKQMPKDADILSMSQAEDCVGYWVCPVCHSGWGDEFEYCPECWQKVRYADERID